MFIAMNRFKVVKGEEAAFIEVWASRKTRLDEMKGFVSFNLLKGPEKEDHTLFSSHTVWETKDDFTAWTRSEQFRDSHSKAGQPRPKPLFLGHPEFEGFESVLGETNPNRPLQAAE
ncbi:antibiotic biosynthesis monooxygenase [Bosea sp. TWI1241]|jgi:heme-degrading monooxygenase HmoA|uniref:antibiotic biosynthesis monooxygenase family protein n=1 Tax=Bosea sp. TWI1241 TaxID=3148904 RepID=UPI0032092869